MAVSDVQLVVNTLLYYFIFVCGFAISIPIGVTTVSIFPSSVIAEMNVLSAPNENKCRGMALVIIE